MNRHTIIVIVASIAIAGTAGFSIWNVFAADQIQIKGIGNEGYFSYFDLTNNKEILVCNPLPMPVNLKEIRISMTYSNEDIGVVHYPDIILESNSESEIEGKLVSERFKQMQYLGLHFDGIYSGAIPSRLNINEMTIFVEIDTPIFGVIPHTETKQFPNLTFWNLMNNQSEEYNC